MKKFLLSICLTFFFQSLFAYDISDISMGTSGLIYADEPFDMNWSAAISFGTNETGMERDIEASFYLSRDPVYNNDDLLITSQVFKSSTSPGFFNQTVTGVLVTKEMNFPAGNYYFIMRIDPDNKIAESNEVNNVMYFSVKVGNRNPDLAVESVEVGKSDQAGVLNVRSIIRNPSDADISSFKYAVRIANTREGLSSPVFSQVYEGGEFKKSSNTQTLKTSIILPQKLDIRNTIYISVSIHSASPADVSSLNDSIVVSAYWPDLKTLIFYETDLLMKSRNDSVYTCSAQIFDDGGEYGPYSNNISSTIRIFPKDPASMIRLTVKPNINLYGTGDAIRIINPEDNSILATLQMKDSDGTTRTYSAGNVDGSIILQFYSDGGYINSGFEVIATCVPKLYKMPYKKKKSITVCNGAVADNGLSGAYQSTAADEMTIYPGEPGSKVTLTFSQFETEAGSDYLEVYNGNSKNTGLIKKLEGFILPSSITSTAEDGSLTLYFVSDFSRTYAGFIANVSCSTVLSAGNKTEINSEAIFNVVPNPNNGNFSLSLFDHKMNSNLNTITVFDAEGKALYQAECTINEEIKLQSIVQPGFYIIKIESPDYGSSYRRFMIE